MLIPDQVPNINKNCSIKQMINQCLEIGLVEIMWRKIVRSAFAFGGFERPVGVWDGKHKEYFAWLRRSGDVPRRDQVGLTEHVAAAKRSISWPVTRSRQPNT